MVALKPAPPASPGATPERSRNAVVALKRAHDAGGLMGRPAKQERRGGIETLSNTCINSCTFQSRNAVVALKHRRSNLHSFCSRPEAGTPWWH